MRIGHFPSGVGEQGGRASYIRRVAAAQQARGHEVLYFDGDTAAREDARVIGVRDSASLFAQAAKAQLDVLHLHTTVTLPDTVPLPTLRSLHTHRPYCPSGTRYLARWNKPCDRSYHALGCLWGHLVDRCGSARPQAILANYGRMKSEWEALRCIPTLTVSRFQRDEMLRVGFPAEPIQTLLSPAPDPKPYFPPPRQGTPRFLFLGRVVPEKGVDWLLRALARCRQPLHLDVAGTGRAEPEIRRLADQLGVADRVTFHGWCDKDQVAALFLSARALVFPSVWHEPAGLVSVEAAAHGRAVVASRVGGIPEYAQPSFSLLVEPHDVEGLARALDRLASDYDEAAALGVGGQEAVEAHFRMRDYVPALETIYRTTQATFASTPTRSTTSPQ